jgi:hypothetical protein
MMALFFFSGSLDLVDDLKLSMHPLGIFGLGGFKYLDSVVRGSDGVFSVDEDLQGFEV